jgi:serine/threonine protein kinase
MDEGASVPVRTVGRYALYGELASGGMATVHLGRLIGSVGFSRTVAIKRLHEQFAKDPEFVSMFLDEARLCARIRHPNVVPTLDVIAEDRQLLLVMEYVQGESLSRLHRAAIAKSERIPLNVAVAILSGVLRGLHAAHEAKDERGHPLGIVHRDVSPQNVVVGADGVARVLDFGIAKAKGRLYTTQDGRVKGKLAYMAPEQLRSDPVDRRADIFAASVMAWELVTGKRLFEGASEGATVTKVLLEPIPTPSTVLGRSPDSGVTASLDRIVMHGLERDPKDRFQTAREMADQLEEAVHSATAAQVGKWVESVAAEALHARATRVQEIESGSTDTRKHIGEAITKLTSDLDVTKTERSSGGGKVAASDSAPSLPELVSKAEIAVSRSQSGMSAPRDPWPRRAAIALALVAVGLVVLVVRMGEPARPEASRGIVATSGVSSESATTAPKAAAESGAGTVTTVPDASAAPASGSPTTSSSSTPASAAPSSSRPEPVHGAPKPAATVDCRDPYTRDALGRKIYKLECL